MTTTATALRVTVAPEPLAAALQAVSRAISPRTTLPILGCVLVEAQGARLTLNATNLEMSIRKVVPAENAEPGAVAVPAKLFADTVASLPSEPLTMTLDPTSLTLALECGRFSAHIRCFDADEFPPGPKADGDFLTIPQATLLRAIEQTAFAATTDEARPVLTGELFDVASLTLVATDGHRLSEVVLPGAEHGDDRPRLVIPARALAELSRALKGEEGDIHVAISAARNHVEFRCGDSEVTSRLIEGQYPNYHQVLPADGSATTTIRIPGAELARALKAVGVFARDGGSTVRLHAREGEFAIRASTNEVGDSVVTLGDQATVEGVEVEIGINARFLADAVAAVMVGGAESVEIALSGPLNPVLVRGRAGCKVVVMPVRLGK
jgi:DNA polymerase-3 subunit beta